MKDRPDCENFIELLEGSSSRADVSEAIANDNEEAIAPMSAPYPQSI
jgi:hypothetical protein